MNQEQIDALWAAVNQLKASAEDGISADQVVEAIDSRISDIQVIGRNGVSGIMSGNTLHLSGKTDFQLPTVTPGETDEFEHPFQITCDGSTWSVGVTGSSVTDGTNGSNAAVGLTGGTLDPGDTKFVCLSADIDPVTLAASNFEVTAQTTAPDEVELNADPTPAQTKVNIVLGKVTDTFPFKSQGVLTALLLTHGLFNGTPVRVFTAYPSHPESL
jgi:hypothetical protein